MCGVMLAMIIFVLDLFKFPVTLNSFTRFPSYTNFIFAAVSYCSYHPVVVLWLLLVVLLLAVALWVLLLLFLRCFSVSPVHIPYSLSSCYIIKKQFHVCPAVFLQVHLVLLPRVPIQRSIISKLYFSKMCSSFINIFLRIFFQFLWTEKMIEGNFPWSLLC